MAHAFALIPASYVFLRRGDEVLLQLRRNTGYMDGHWVAGAAGHVEPGETARQAAVREAAEELGVVLRPQDLELATVMHRTDGTDHPREQRVEWFWTAIAWDREPVVQEPHKAVEVRWWSLDALPDPVPDYELSVLHGLRDGGLPVESTFGFVS
ncbi:NUDIX domain-containing protein [Microbacterium sp. CIAB417]|uniref:NUDIX hydrolase n=1 Tax=Microbacterium sp. CIAB417 TaxID=2860287 RepID=UPI001FAC17CB|nr:NUDIX domain-containing protein [Microbacterium sp. CIAB417]